MLSLRGRLARKWLSSYTTKTKDGTYLNIPGPNACAIQVPVVTEIKYLGVVLSYADFEMATLKYRVGCVPANHSRLVRILHSRNLSLPKRVALWRACVCTSAVYGLHAVGLGRKHLHKLACFLTRQVCAIARSFAHMTKESNHRLHERLHLQSPLQMLRARLYNLQQHSAQSQDPQVSSSLTHARLSSLSDIFDALEGTGTSVDSPHTHPTSLW